MSVVVVGLNQRTVPLELLERMTVPAATLPKALADLSSREHVSEVVLLSTCLRTEVYVETDRYHGAVADVRNFLAELSFLAPEEFSDRLYTYNDEVAVAHLFKVAAGLDSAVLGEGEILGQVRDAWDAASEERVAGPVLTRLFRHAVEVGKRARTESGITRGTTSLSQAAVALATGRLGSLEGRRALVIGAGDMGGGMAVALAAGAVTPKGGAAGGLAELLVVNRTFAKAETLAGEAGGRAIPMSELDTALAQVDLVLSSTGSPEIVLETSAVAAALPARGGRTLLVIDLAVPRDVDPGVAELEGVTLLDMDDITAFAEAGMAGRRAEAAKVEVIVADEVERYIASASARSAAPLVAALHDRAEAVRIGELARQRARLAGLDDRQREAVEAVTRGIVAKLLHEPTVRVKDAAGTARGERLAEALRALFDLEP